MGKRAITREAGKVRLELFPAIAKAEASKALDHGNRKDGRSPWNWRVKPVLLRDQMGGLLRHADAFNEGEDFDPASRAHHLGHVIARASIMLDAIQHGTLVDDRILAKKARRKK